MKNLIFYPFFLFALNLSSFSQRIIEIKHDQDAQGNYQFYCINNAYCNYIFEINFTTLDNAKSDHPLPYRTVVKPGSNKLFKLSKENVSNPIQFKYEISYNKGCINPKVNPDFTYLLPFAPGKEAQAYTMDIGKPNSGEPESKGWYVIRIKMKPGDTIYSARRGTVAEVEVGSDKNDLGLASAGSENYIEIVHADCSFGHYGILRKNGAFVKPGQFVEAGVPIGLVGGDKYGRGSEVRFSVYYNEDTGEGGEGTSKKIYWVYIPLTFWTKNNGIGKLKHGGTYISEHPVAIINQEKPKPEMKKRSTHKAKR